MEEVVGVIFEYCQAWICWQMKNRRGQMNKLSQVKMRGLQCFDKIVQYTSNIWFHVAQSTQP